MIDELAVDLRGEVFTPTFLVNEMMGKLPPDLFTDDTKTFLDNSCGDGQFLVSILNKRMVNRISHLDALQTIYGIEIDSNNVKKCKARLSLGKKSKKIWAILDRNIICADTLDKYHKGWESVGYMWDETRKPIPVDARGNKFFGR